LIFSADTAFYQIVAVTAIALAVGAAVLVIPIGFSMSAQTLVENFHKDRKFLSEQGVTGIINHMSMCTILSIIQAGHYSIKCSTMKN
jgi:hypothetical protein